MKRFEETTARIESIIHIQGMLGVAFAIYMGYAGEMVEWLGKVITTLKNDAIAAFGAIGNALAEGDIAMAAEIFWETIKLEFQRGKAELEKMWSDFTFGLNAMFIVAKSAVIQTWLNLVKTLKTAWADFVFIGEYLFINLKHGIIDVWYSMIGAMKNAWATFSQWHASTVNSWPNTFAKAIVKAQSMFDDTIDVEFAYSQIDKATAEEQKRIDDEYRNKISANNTDKVKAQAENEKARDEAMSDASDANNKALDEANKEFETETADNEAAKNKALTATASANEQKIDAINQKLKAAKEKWKKLIDTANSLGKEGEEPQKPESPTLPDGKELAGQLSSALAAAARSVRGSFEYVRGFGSSSGSAAERTAKATEQTAKHTEEMKRNMSQGFAWTT